MWLELSLCKDLVAIAKKLWLSCDFFLYRVKRGVVLVIWTVSGRDSIRFFSTLQSHAGVPRPDTWRCVCEKAVFVPGMLTYELFKLLQWALLSFSILFCDANCGFVIANVSLMFIYGRYEGFRLVSHQLTNLSCYSTFININSSFGSCIQLRL